MKLAFEPGNWNGGRQGIVLGRMPLPVSPDSIPVKAPLGLANARDMLESAIIQADLDGRNPEPNRKDPVWITYCFYLSKLAEAALKLELLDSKWGAVPQALRSGGVLVDYSYVGINCTLVDHKLVDPEIGRVKAFPAQQLANRFVPGLSFEVDLKLLLG